jgi:NAD(P)-dependent dehydrogenase (short-subunit alcohol dehydrogenase family)
MQQAQARFGPVNILVNNAGQASSQPFAKTDAALWQQMLNVNLTGTYHCIQAVLPGMLEAAKAGTPGRIVNIASTAGLKGYAYVSAYVAAKHGVIGLTRALALELARQHITVNAVCPGWIKTEMDIADQGSGAYGDDDIINRVPMAKFATPEDVARTIAFLAGDGSFINGVSLPVDGGWTADASWDALRLKAR